MGAVLDIYVWSNKYISFKFLLDKTAIEKFQYSICDVMVMDNWEYEHSRYLSTANLDMKMYVDDKKIVSFTAKLDNKYSAGGLQYKEQKETYVTNLWLDLSDLPHLDRDFIDEGNQTFYKLLTHRLCQHIDEFDIQAIAMGVELVMSDSPDLEKMISNSLNVVRWIVPQNRSLNVPGFDKEEFPEYNVTLFSKRNNSM